MPHPDLHRTPPAVLERWMAQAIRQREAAERANEIEQEELHGATERFLIRGEL